GMVAAMARALERHGTIGLARALAPAIALARDGFEIDYYLALAIASCADRLWPHPESKRVFFKAGGLPPRPALGLEAADRVAQPDLARTLETIAGEGPGALYRGNLARAIVDDVRANGGLLTLDDLASYRVRELAPLDGRYRGRRVLTLPETAGGITVIEALHVLDGLDLGALEQSGARSLHLLAEAQRRAFLDRLAYLHDPAFGPSPFAALASREYADAIRARIDPERADVNAGPGPVAAFAPEAVAAASPSGGARPDDVPHTTHICAVDAERTLVSLTSTLGQGFGSGVVPAGTGIVMADVMTWFDPEAGRASSIAPGKRILWAPAPAVVLQDDRPLLAVGAPGGRKLISAVLQTIVNVVDHGDAPQDAVNRPRVHCEGRETWIDARVRADVRDALAAMGHELVVLEETLSSTWFGRPNAILVDGDVLRAGVNRLKPSLAAGW
ncbi:MAG: gamma-glutamyltransferase family protein, partial [Candidatus Limnocylindria bacterium]